MPASLYLSFQFEREIWSRDRFNCQTQVWHSLDACLATTNGCGSKNSGETSSNWGSDVSEPMLWQQTDCYRGISVSITNDGFDDRVPPSSKVMQWALVVDASVHDALVVSTEAFRLLWYNEGKVYLV